MSANTFGHENNYFSSVQIKYFTRPRILQLLLGLYLLFLLNAAFNNTLGEFYMKRALTAGLIEPQLPAFQKPAIVVPFKSDALYPRLFAFNFAANLLLFFPLGILCSANLWKLKRRAVIAFLSCSALSVVIEGIQLFLPYRQTDVNDIIANAIGALAGILAYALLQKHIEDPSRR